MANQEQREFWNREAGPAWVEFQERLDAQIRPYGELAMERGGFAPGEVVLDVGCGCGDTTLELAHRVGPEGEVLGVDVSAPMLARARERAEAARVRNVRFLEADAQSAKLPPAHFDAVFSRFGVMFFESTAAAFANLAGSLREGGRVVFVCWQAAAENPWIAVPMAAVAPLFEMPPPAPPDAPGMFQLAKPERVATVLGEAGLVDIELEDVRIDSRLGGGIDRAVEFFLEVSPLRRLLREQDPAGEQREAVVEALRGALAPHDRGEGPVLSSAVWLVTANRT